MVFYDSGCYGASFSDKAFGVLPSELVRNGPTKLEVAGGMTVLIEHGDYNISLNLINEQQFIVKATISVDWCEVGSDLSIVVSHQLVHWIDQTRIPRAPSHQSGRCSL